MNTENTVKIIMPNGNINPVFVKAVKKILDQKNNYSETFENLEHFKNELPDLWKSAYSSILTYDEEVRCFKSITFESEEDLTFFLLKNGL